MEIRHVTLIRPPVVYHELVLASAWGSPPLVLAALNAVLRDDGYQVTIIDAFGEDFDHFERVEKTPFFFNGLNIGAILDRVPEHTDFIGLSCMFSNEWIYHKKVINALTDHFPGVPVVVGGEHASAIPEYVLQFCPGILACILGEGEASLLELLQCLKNDGNLESVDGLVYRGEKNRFIHNRRRKRIRDIDTLPWLNWDGIPLRKYMDRGIAHGVNRGRNLPMLASRGCPYRCAFCSNRQMWDQKWRIRSARSVVDELKARADEYNIDSFSFFDLTFVIRKDWTLEFTRLLKESGLQLEWHMPSGTRCEVLDTEVLHALRETGLKQITYAPESGSPHTLGLIGKKLSLDTMIRSIRACVREGIFCKTNMVCGFPGERRRDILLDTLFIIRLAWTGVHDVPVHPFVPYPGSAFYEQLAAEAAFPPPGDAFDLFLANNCNNKYSEIVSWNEIIGNRELQFYCLVNMMVFYSCQYLFRPWRLFSMLSRLLRSEPVTLPERVILNMANRFRHLMRWKKRAA
jgi:anaerobic magnesium-protoporphyrin IX monomethyl ester cyclase